MVDRRCSIPERQRAHLLPSPPYKRLCVALPLILSSAALLCFAVASTSFTSFTSSVGARSLTLRQLPLCACVHASFARW